ncbi:hypothetical protein PB2503_04282 [Parvularcula bermudensis HTCC2503]|uniref:Sulfotransferase domain-containing protein n=1 Tax=Parvularcula bermudensis (strain ATCC BAA-594 / HTCC2503 / KCTC 12087) TaxID=314260 RepID=E0TEP8_PARBH|nr:sulfotransferase [Parvularcula bermudensis]ADM08931.1 hypothetical protein PB2503_04282 [Parvularcula bermudensis HTCC2503]
MAVPDFVIVGAMKAATTTLAAQLDAQPGIALSREKEPSFFAKEWGRSADWYDVQWKGAAATDLKGEASTDYAKWPAYPEAPARLLRWAPGVKIIYLLRDPLDRAFSHAIHEMKKGRHLGPPDAVARDLDLIWQVSCYAAQLDRWLAVLPPERVLLMSSDRLAAMPEDEFARALTFLGCDGKWSADRARLHGRHDAYRPLPGQRFLVDNAAATALRRRLVPKSWRASLRRRRGLDIPDRFSEATEAYLKARIAPDLARLGGMTGRTLSFDTFRAEMIAAPPTLVGQGPIPARDGRPADE